MLEKIRGGSSNFAKKFHFYTLVTDKKEYDEMIASALDAGFSQKETLFSYFDNITNNLFDGYSGINYAIRNSPAQYLIFCHQDVLFNKDKKAHLEKLIEEIEAFNTDWAVIGNAGKTVEGNVAIRISDPIGGDIKRGFFPCEVASLDENFLVINRNVNISCSYTLHGYHLYATDLCQNAIYLGLKCYVVNFHLTHKSSGKVDISYDNSLRSYKYLQILRKKPQFIRTMIKDMFVSGSWMLNFFCNIKYILAFSKSLSKKKSKIGQK